MQVNALNAIGENVGIIPLYSSYEVKRNWMYSEWDGGQFQAGIKFFYKNREQLLDSDELSRKKVKAIFLLVRGQFNLVWGPEREKGKWFKVTCVINPQWMIENVCIIWETSLDKTKEHPKPPEELHGLVLWKASEGYQSKDGDKSNIHMAYLKATIE